MNIMCFLQDFVSFPCIEIAGNSYEFHIYEFHTNSCEPLFPNMQHCLIKLYTVLHAVWSDFKIQWVFRLPFDGISVLCLSILCHTYHEFEVFEATELCCPQNPWRRCLGISVWSNGKCPLCADSIASTGRPKKRRNPQHCCHSV